MSARTSTTRGTKAALDGFEYQLNVSVFAALRLMLITKSATRITLEPANDEDLEADLQPSAPGRVQPRANMAEGYKLVVQVKLSNSGPWSISKLKALLNYGKTRQPAKFHLDDPGTRYLLITNADATEPTRKLLVQVLGEWPEEQAFPPSLKTILTHTPEGRIAILGVLTERHLDLEINDILVSLLRVPQSQLLECRRKLRDEAFRRMRGASPGVWTREDLLSVVRGYGGYLASAPQLESFVPPANYQALTKLLHRRNAIVIAGPSGTGKTLTAESLIDQARQRPSAPEVVEVNVNNGPSSTRMLSGGGPKLFYVEDPWGQYSLRGGADIWTAQLPRLLREAHDEHQYVVTSRTDMLDQAGANEGLGRWTIVLDADQYRDGELAKIYDKRLDLIATDLQAKALSFRADALDALETPLEVDLFYTYLADGPQSSELDHVFFKRILALAHRDAVEGVVDSYLASSDQNGESAIVWVLLAARSQFDRNQLVYINRQLRAVDPNFVDGLDKIVNRLVATRHLRQPSQVVSFSHPSVRAGFETFIEKNWGRSEAALVSLISALTQLGGPQREWALETAARSLKAISDLISDVESLNVEFETDCESRTAIDTWLEDSLVDPQSDFRAVLQLASDVGARTSIPSELARWFIKGIQRLGQFPIKDWKPLVFDDAWYERVSVDSRTFTIAERFVREQIPQDRDGFADDLAIQLDRIASGLTPAFVKAAHKMVSSGFDTNVEAVAAGAVRDIDRFEPVLDAALDELADVDRFYEQEGKEHLRAFQDGESDEADEESFQFHHQDDGYAANTFVAAYVNRVRLYSHWSSLSSHSRTSELGRAWAVDISRTSGTVSLEELRAVIAATWSSQDEILAWKAVREHWESSLASDLKQRILSNPNDDSLRCTLVECALMVSPKTLSFCLEKSSATSESFVQFLVDMDSVYRQISSKTHMRCLVQLLDSISSTGTEIFKALSVNDKTPSAVGPTALSLLTEAAKTASPFVLNKIVPVMIVSGLAPSAAIRRWLVETEDNQLSKAATEFAIRIQDDELVWFALGHARADARMASLDYLANSLPNPLPQRLLDMSSDPGSRVRRNLVRILKDRLHPNHQSVLVRLIEDTWSDANAFYNESPSYKIAREAVNGLAVYKSLSNDVGEALLFRAEHTDDHSLGFDALNTAAKCCGPAIRKKIWALSFINQPRQIHINAINVLIQADVVESDILDGVNAELILSLAPPLAASVCVLLAVHGRVDSVVEAMQRIALSTQRRALLLLGAYGLTSRDRKAADRLMALLDIDHPARNLLDLKEEEKLPKTALDDLGHIRIRNVVHIWLKDKIATG